MKKRIILRELERNLNSNWISSDGYYTEVSGNYFDNIVTLSIHDKKNEEAIIDLQVVYVDDITELISEFIDKLMEQYMVDMSSDKRENSFYYEILEMFLNAREYLINNVA